MCYTNWIIYFEGMIQIWIFELIYEAQLVAALLLLFRLWWNLKIQGV